MNAQTSPPPFRADTLDIDGDQIHLIGSSCDSCGARAFPQRRVCAACRSANLRQVRLGRTGRLYTYAIVRQAPKEFSTPYIIGYVDLDEGVRVFTRLITSSERDLRLGMRMTLRAALLPGGGSSGDTVAYAFTPEAEG
jgi:uncharacterized OB-fold protein